MKLFFDARYIKVGFHDGISRYSTELGKALAPLHDDITFIICDERQKALLPEGAKTIQIHSPTSAKEPFTSLILNKYSPDVVFTPMQTMGSFGRKFKLILTLHDLIYYSYRTPPSEFNIFIRGLWWLYHSSYAPQRFILNRADSVATVSYTSKDEIEKNKLTKKPVIVTYNAPQKLASYLPNRSQKMTSSDKPNNLVYMGSFIEYKNVETLIDGMEFLPEYTLHLLSRVKPARKQQLQARIPKGASVVFHNGVSDETYAQLLSQSAIAVSASFNEGFGIPIADALALGVPAVISDITTFHEVAGDGASYFNPHKPADFAKAVKNASQPSVYNTLAQKGKKQTQKFSWQTSAETSLNEAQRLYAQRQQ